MAVKIGSARSSYGNTAPGDQNGGKEVSTENWYLHSKGWIVLRATDPAQRELIAVAMERACDNNDIGYSQPTRNTLTTVRKLKAAGVEVYFEKENIFTLDSKGELLITIMSSLAQEESRSISENVTWGMRKRFAEGKPIIPYGAFLGYRKGPDGMPEIDPEQAETVRYIYRAFLEGKAPSYIARDLTARGILTPGGKTTWRANTVMSILTNEKYKGDALLQKTFCTDFLTKAYKVNEGEVPQYYVEHSHPAIIDRAIEHPSVEHKCKQNIGKVCRKTLD